MSKLKIDIRRDKILELLRQNGEVSVSALSEQLGATPVTIRNDLDALEQDGYLIRRQGGAIAAGNKPQSFEGFARTAVNHIEEKNAIAAKLVEMIHDGDTIFLNSGTTTRIIASALKARSNLRIVTNSLAIAMELSSVSSFSVILLGGEVNVQYGFVSGVDAQQQLSKYQAEWGILSVDGISRQSGVTTYHAEEAIINQMMLDHAKTKIIAADYSKLGRAGFSTICALGPNIHLVTDKRCDQDTINILEEHGLEITIA